MLNVEFVQFVELLDGINAIGLTEDQIKVLATYMKVDPRSILNNATKQWDELKHLIKNTPLTEDQISEELAETGRVEALVPIDFYEIIGHLTSDTMERVIDDMAARLGIGSDSNIEHKVLFAENDTLYVKVSAAVVSK